MKLPKLGLGLSLPLAIGCTFYHAEVGAQTLVRKQQKFSQELIPPLSSPEKKQAQKALPTNTRTAAVVPVSDQQAQEQPTTVKIFPGRSSVIDFRNGERMNYIELANQERILYNTDAPLESGRAKLITIRLSEPLPFKGQTRPPGFGQRSSTNLIVTTIERSGEQKTYIFDLLPATGIPGSADRNGIAIVPQASLKTGHSQNIENNSSVQTNLGPASLTDISKGLQISITRQYSASDDPIVFQVEEWLALARNGVPFREAAKQLNIPLSVIVSLGEIGIFEHIKSGLKLPIQNTSAQKFQKVFKAN